MSQLNLFTDGTWPSTEAVTKIVYEILEDGPASLSVSQICLDSGYSAHSVRRALRFLESGGVIQKIPLQFDERGRPVFLWKGGGEHTWPE